MNRTQDTPGHAQRPAVPPEDSQPATVIQRDPGEYLAQTQDIGRAVGNHTRELFVSCDPAQALAQLLQLRAPIYIALHDLACTASRKLLRAIAGAAGKAVEHITIRRQGFGTQLADLEYLDCPAANGQTVRLYSTDAEADSSTRHALADVLLGHASLGVVMVGDLPGHAINHALQPLRDQIFAAPWRCPQLQFIPLSPHASGALATLVRGLGAGSGVTTGVTPLVVHTLDAWNHLCRTWNHTQANADAGSRAPLLETLSPPREPVQAMPAAPAASSPPQARPRRPSGFLRFLDESAKLPGVTALCVFDLATSRVVASSVSHSLASDLARRGSLLMAAATTSRKVLALNGEPLELIVMGSGTLAQGLRLLASQPGLGVHVLFNPSVADWPTLRPRLMALDAALPRQNAG
jgi:hypothetical protein